MARIARRRGPKGPVGTPAGRSARVVAPQQEQVSRWSRYSSTSGRTGGISATWCRTGSGSSPRSAAPQPAQCVGLTSKVSRSRSGGTSARVRRVWPGWPPLLRPDGGAGGRRLTLTAGGSVEGGLDELVEFWLSRASRSAIRLSREAMTARRAAWASGGTVLQSDSGIEGCGLIYRILRAYYTKRSSP